MYEKIVAILIFIVFFLFVCCFFFHSVLPPERCQMAAYAGVNRFGNNVHIYVSSIINRYIWSKEVDLKVQLSA